MDNDDYRLQIYCKVSSSDNLEITRKSVVAFFTRNAKRRTFWRHRVLIQNNLIDVRDWMPEGHLAESNDIEHLRLLKPTMHRVHTTCGGESCHLFYRRVSSNFTAMTAHRAQAGF